MLKFYVGKDATKNSLSFYPTKNIGKLPKLKDYNFDCKTTRLRQNCNFSLTKIGKKRNREMLEPIETEIICA